MSVERNALEARIMRDPVADRSEYLGAMLTAQQRLVLVPMDPKEPWEAFRRLRTWMKQSKETAETPMVDVFESPLALENQAKVISLDSKRRTG